MAEQSDDFSYAAIVVRRDSWASALRYNGLERHTGELADSCYSAFCCLGVAYECIPDLGGERVTGDESFGMYTDPSVPGVSLNTVLSNKARRLLGLTREQMSILTTINDAGGNFNMIANVMEVMEIHPDLEGD